MYRRSYRHIERGIPQRSFSTMLSDGLALKAGDSLSLYGFPHALTILNVALIPAAMPARTLANSCRQISQQFVTLLELHATRRMSQPGPANFDEFHIAASAISSFHLVCVGFVDLSAGLIFSVWLPHLAPTIRDYLPGLLIEQVLLSAVTPSSSLFVARGKFRLLGLSKLAGASLGICVLGIIVNFTPRAAFGIAYAASTIPFFALGCWGELKGLHDFPAPTLATWLRYGRAIAIATCYLFYPVAPLVAPTLALALSLPSLAHASWSVFKRFSGSYTRPAQDLPADHKRAKSVL
jgi:hypothetical protein